MSTFIKKQDKIMHDRDLISGLKTHFEEGDVVYVDGKRYSPSDLVDLLEERIQLSQEVLTARGAWQAAVARERANIARTAPVFTALEQTIHMRFGRDAEPLAEFGLAPRKERRKLTGEEKASMTAKIRATRAARHTLGKRQRLALRAIRPAGEGGGEG
jgi:hypothetical protein